MISITFGYIIVAMLTCSTVGRNVDGKHTTFKNRIVNGEDARINDFPYQVALMIKISENFIDFCGGSIISENVIITAAHCVVGKPLNMLFIRAGSEYGQKGGVVLSVSKIISHESYSDATVVNDIALILLETDLIFSSTIQPIQLATSDLPDGTFLTATGWGLTENGRPSDQLQVVDMPIVNQAKCTSWYEKCPRKPVAIVPSMLCTGYLGVEIKRTNRGDSGGPLVFDGKLYGITSFGMPDIRSTGPVVNTRVAAFQEWIEYNLQLLAEN